MNARRYLKFYTTELTGASVINPRLFGRQYVTIMRYMRRFPRQRCARLEARILRNESARNACLKLYLESFPEWKEGHVALFCDEL